jgi:hypothetical protein
MRLRKQRCELLVKESRAIFRAQQHGHALILSGHGFRIICKRLGTAIGLVSITNPGRSGQA